MIKSIKLKPFDGSGILPAYMKELQVYTLLAKVKGNYEITLARLTVGDLLSGSKKLFHALFESYTDHGKKMRETKSRVNGFERDFIAVKSAMFVAGIEFNPIAPCHFSELLKGLGAYYQAVNPEIQEYAVVSQKCY